MSFNITTLNFVTGQLIQTMNTLDTFAHTREKIQSPVLAMALSYHYLMLYKGQTDLLHETTFHIPL